MNPREAFLERVRQAVHHGPRTAVRTVPPRAQLGYQGAGPDPVGRFCQELASAGGQAHRVGSAEEAWRVVEEIARRCQAKNVTLGQGGLVERLEIPRRLRDAGMDLTISTDPAQGAGPFFAADLGVTNVEYLIAETGTVVMAAKPAEPRSTSLLPPVHIALAETKQILPDLFDLFDLFSPLSAEAIVPSCLTLITGPSKTGDIELRLVTGVHGPGEIHVVLVSGEWVSE
jgi:L-lactate utilization protein LutC